MDMNFGKFYDYLMEGGEAKAKTSGTKGKTFAELIGPGEPWYYIPHPTNGKDFGNGGKGTGEFKILVVERNNLWDIFLLHQTSTATTKAIDTASVNKAAEKIAANRQRANNTVVNSDMNMERLLAISESYFAGKLTEGKALNEGTGAGGSEDHGDETMKDNTEYTCTHAEVGMPFENILKLCVTAVTGQAVEGSGSGLLSAMAQA